ncbi:putative wbscr22 protein [Jimgerdemannia flammicorona]|uniref:Putative wbscr22 protein n=1 Tax=Jimgerdemannia flammicorona TaxID=994334 RepID=A0A433P5W6_9FUNG|nr:putative wbscr22 protein [Jimgerdemannia flammicorona]
MLVDSATRCGFEGGLLVDYPNSKRAKKYYLCLFAGQALSLGKNVMPRALGEDGAEEPEAVAYERRRGEKKARGEKRKPVKGKEWIAHKKELARKRGDKTVANDSKYTGRKRKVKF